MEKVTLWGLDENKWVKRRSFNFDNNFKWNRKDHAKPYEEQYNTIHAFFPHGINPNDYPVIFEMLNIVNKKVKGYKEDFLYHDCISYFEFEQDVVWSVRETGTYLFKVNGQYDNKESKDTTLLLYGYIEGCKYNYYRIQDSKLKTLKFAQGLSLLSEKPIKIEMAAA